MGALLGVVSRVLGPMDKLVLARIFHTRVAADVSRRHLGCGKDAPTDVGGYTLLASRAECEMSGLGCAERYVVPPGKPASERLRPTVPPCE
jgi:hypothetical protein